MTFEEIIDLYISLGYPYELAESIALAEFGR
jgi:hypothetical protein